MSLLGLVFKQCETLRVSGRTVHHYFTILRIKISTVGKINREVGVVDLGDDGMGVVGHHVLVFLTGETLSSNT